MERNQHDGAAASDEIVYRISDDSMVGETPGHADAIGDAYQTLKVWFRDCRNVKVSISLHVYYEQHHPNSVVRPHLSVLRETPAWDGIYWKTWEHRGRCPQFVLEVTSRSTRRAEQEPKPEAYRTMGVEEYFQFDPLGEYDPALQGLRLVNGEYKPLPLGDKRLGLPSAVLGLDLYVEEDGALRFRDPAEGQRLLTAREESEGRLEAEAQLAEAEARRREAEARVRELEARLRSRPG